MNARVAATVVGSAPKNYRSSFDLAVEAGLISRDLADRLRPSVGLRNVLAHEYLEVDLQLVAEATELALRDYPAYVRSMAAWLREPPVW